MSRLPPGRGQWLPRLKMQSLRGPNVLGTSAPIHAMRHNSACPVPTEITLTQPTLKRSQGPLLHFPGAHAREACAPGHKRKHRRRAPEGPHHTRGHCARHGAPYTQLSLCCAFRVPPLGLTAFPAANIAVVVHGHARLLAYEPG